MRFTTAVAASKAVIRFSTDNSGRKVYADVMLPDSDEYTKVEVLYVSTKMSKGSDIYVVPVGFNHWLLARSVYM